MEKFTVVIPFYNGHDTIHALLADLPTEIEALVVDDCSDEALIVYRPNTRVYRLESKGYFTGAVNFGISQCGTDVLILNQDIRLVGDEWLNLIEEHRYEYALFGESIKGRNLTFPKGYVHGVFQYMRRDALDKVGMMDAVNYPLWGASALWQLSICRAGFRSCPIEKIPGLTHLRDARAHYGSSIAQLLKKDGESKELLIRTPPAISVVMPCYNYGRFLRDSVHSLIGGETSLGYMPGQTFQSFEIIIINDGSKDETEEVALSLVNDWNGIRYISQKNAGTPAANNAGIKVAVGKYVTHQSADDMREPWSLNDLYQAAIHNPDRVIYDELVEFNNDKRTRKWELAEYDFELLLHRNMMHAGILFPKAAWAKVGGYPELMRHGREDWAFNVALGEAGYCGLKIGRSGYLYRRQGQNRTLTNGSFEWRQTFLSQMQSLFPHLYRGERPMSGCCSGNRPPRASSASRGASNMATPQQMLGEMKMVLVRYEGTSIGSVNWGGPGTSPSGRYYRFGKTAREQTKYVEQRDWEEWLNHLRENDLRLFTLAVIPAIMPIMPAASTAVGVAAMPTAGLAPAHTVSEPMMKGPPIDMIQAQEKREPDIDPGEYSLKSLKELQLTRGQWQDMKLLEKRGKNRVGVMDLINERAM